MSETYESEGGETIEVADHDRWVARAQEALDVLDQDGEIDNETKLDDLLTHLRHYCHWSGIDFDAALATSAMHFEAEQRPKPEAWS